MRDLALLMFVTATLPMSFTRPLIGLLLWIWFSYMNPHRITWGFATSFPWVMIVALVTIATTLMHADQRQRIPARPVVVLMTLFLLWVGATMLAAVEPALAQQYTIRFVKIMMLAYFTLILVTNKQDLHWVLWVIVLSFGFWGFKGGLFTVLSGGGYHVLGPIQSFFRDNNQFALVMCMTIPLMRYLQLQEKRKSVNYGLWVLMGLTAFSVIGTYSRGGFLALGATVLMLVFKSRQRVRLMTVMTLVAAVIFAFMPQKYYQRLYTINNYQKNASAHGRIESWKFATNYAIHHPLLGGGLRMWASDSAWNRYGPPGASHRAIHSIWFQILGEQSFIGLGLYIGLLVFGWVGLARIRKRTRDGPDTVWMADLASMIQVSLVAFVTAGTFLPMAYFDLMFQLLALTALLQVFSVAATNQSEATVETVESSAPASGGRPASPGLQVLPQNRQSARPRNDTELPRW